MTDIPSFHAPDDPLDRAADTLRRASVPEGPPEETITRTLAALRAATEAKPIPFYRRKLMRYALRVAAVVLVAAGAALYFTGILPPRPALAFAEVAAKLHDARTLTYELTVEYPNQKDPVKMKVLYKEPGLMRFENEGVVVIINLKQGKYLLLNPADKTAMLIDYKRDGNPEKDVASQIEELRKLVDKKGEPVGKKRVIGDTVAEGFRVEDEGFPLTVWADPKMKMPVLIEMSIGVGDREALSTMSNFQLDTKLDDSLFRLEFPDDYRLRKMETRNEKPEDDVAFLLRAYAEEFDGKFPKSLRIASVEWQNYLKKHWGGKGEKKEKGLPEPEFMRFVQAATRIEMFLHTNKDHGYKPDGVKFRDRDKIVFWYRPDKAGKYRAVYGDLYVKDVTADQLPEKPKK
jgi:outer membrane lipoprotein-sorting protein